MQGLWFQHLSPILNRFHDFPFLVLSVSEEADKHRNEHENFVLLLRQSHHLCIHTILHMQSIKRGVKLHSFSLDVELFQNNLSLKEVLCIVNGVKHPLAEIGSDTICQITSIITDLRTHTVSRLVLVNAL